ncbi:hypothetical protein [Croceitalea rosinachiae]|uniref:Adhesin domain-containing protein n=1 Tax=Croceitalea rosinachiae TaxID=3075596 RepID=A0ABU3A9T3_9FLAO|nr:hypothetical protein [Croceitalea sp. F388]MDT0606938.1 hypothetical protein [Croceitalea sp. F388]
MNKNRQILFKSLVFTLVMTMGLSAQTESKTYKETFNVSEDAVLEINTTHTDIEFETWDKNEVEIIATVELEGASNEEAAEYLKAPPFKMIGNSSEIEISTSGKNTFGHGLLGSDFVLGFDNEPFVEPLFLDIVIPELPEIVEWPEMAIVSPIPPMNFKQFDYDAYKKDGDKYLKEFTKQFRQDFDKEYKQKLEEWGEEYEERAEELAERMEERNRERAERMEKRATERAERMEERARLMEERREKMEEEREQRSFFMSRDSDDDEPSIFYFSLDGEGKKYKVKKTIKIKMPKSTRLKMNVKHGEVKLAATTKNMNASLRYASLLASTIEGEQTDIRASYSPVIVQKWNYGQLKADYAEHVSLKEVVDLRLNATSSNIIIDRLNDRAMIVNDLGELVINAVSNNFTDIDVTVQNGEFQCKMPSDAVSLYLNGTKSKIVYPSDLKMNTTNNFETIIHKGYKNNNNSGKLITVNSKYSEVVLEN